MKHLLLAFILTVFSYNSFAAGRCVISFEGAGKDNIDQKSLSKNNYQEADMMDIGEGDLLSSVTEIKHDKTLSNDDYQVISFIQTIQRTYLHGRDLRLEVIHTKKIMTKLTTAEFIALDTPDMIVLIGKLRGENLPSCTHR
jgi:hypothetical protein